MSEVVGMNLYRDVCDEANRLKAALDAERQRVEQAEREMDYWQDRFGETHTAFLQASTQLDAALARAEAAERERDAALIDLAQYRYTRDEAMARNRQLEAVIGAAREAYLHTWRMQQPVSGQVERLREALERLYGQPLTLGRPGATAPPKPSAPEGRRE